MRGRHSAGGWSPFWRDTLLRTILTLLLVALAAFIWWLFSEDDLFTDAVPTTSGSTVAPRDTTPTTEADITSTTSTRPSTTLSTVSEATTSTTVAVTTTPSTIPPPLDPSELMVRVLNANGVGGVAGRTTDLFEAAGYGVATPANHPQRLDVSRVWYRDDLAREAREIQETLVPDALVEAIPLEQEGIDIVVVLGRSFAE